MFGHRGVEHLERRRDHLERLVALGRVAFGLRQADGVQGPDVDAAVDLGDGPKAPLPGARFGFQRGGIESAVAMLLGEVERDRQRFKQHEAVVDDDRQPAVGIDGQKLRRLGAGVADLDRQVLVIDPGLFRHPQRAEGAGAGDAVNAQAGHAVSPHSRRSIDEFRRFNKKGRPMRPPFWFSVVPTPTGRTVRWSAPGRGRCG